MRRAVPAGVATALAALVAAFAPSSAAGSEPLALEPIVRITTPGVSACPAEGEPETTITRLGIWVAYNDDHQCPVTQVITRVEEVQLVPPQGQPKFIPLDAPTGQVVGGDPDLAPAPDGGVYVSTLWYYAPHEGLSVRILHIDRSLHVHALPTPSFHKDGNDDDKEFIAVDGDPRSPYAGRLYAVWDDYFLDKTVFRAWDGDRWLKPVLLQPDHGAPDVAVGPDGVIAVAMESADGRGVRVRISHDGRRHFGKPILALKGQEPGYADPSCPLRPTVGIRQRAMMGARVAFDQSGDLHVVASTGTFDTVAGDEVHGPAVVGHALLRGRRVVHAEPVNPATTDEQWAPALAVLPTGGIAVSWLQTNGTVRDTYDAWIAVQRAGAGTFDAPQRLSLATSKFPAAMEGMGNSNCYGVGDYIGMTVTPDGVATVWPTTDTDTPGVDSDVLLRRATAR